MKKTTLILLALMGLTTVVQAWPAEFGSRYRVKYLAYELAEAAHRASVNVEYCDNLSQSTRALAALDNLDRKAQRFNRKVKRNHRRLYRTERAYWDLLRTYRKARRHMRHGHTALVVLEDMDRIGRLLNRLGYLYDGYGYYGDYRRYDNDHYGDDHYYGEDYGHGYHGKKSKGRRVKPPRRTTPDY